MILTVKQSSLAPIFKFDGISVRRDAKMHWIICAHLRPILETLLANGAAIAAVDDGWSRVEFVVNLDRGYRAEIIEKAIARTALQFGINDDPHYPLDCQLVCTACKQGLSWPRTHAHLALI